MTNLDVGIGIGEFNEFTLVPRADVCLDIYLPRRKLKEQFVRGDAEYLPFRDESFQTVFAYNVLEHLAHPYLALEELLRVGFEIKIRQDRWFHLGSYTTDSHLWFQRSKLRFLPYPRTRIGILFSKWLKGAFDFISDFKVKWARNKQFSFSPILDWITSEKVAQELITISSSRGITKQKRAQEQLGR